MTTIAFVIIETPDPAAADTFYNAALDPAVRAKVKVRASQAPTTGFRGFTLSLVVSQPSGVDSLMSTAVQAGATELRQAKKSFWGYGGVFQAPDGSIWTVASSSKKDTGPVTREVEDVVLQLGVDDVKASKRFYADRGLAVAKSFGGRYVEFESAGSALQLTLLPRHTAAKNAGVAPDGTGSHRIVICGDAGQFTDPDGFAWEAAPTGTDMASGISLSRGDG